jgi:hypothetical protein
MQKSLPYYMYYSKALGGTWEDVWAEWDITPKLQILTNEELTACLFHQPLIAELIAEVMKERDERTLSAI